MGPGHCYRLFSSAVFNDYFPAFSIPEIQRVPIEGVVLQMKSMGINQVIGFPFPTPPSRTGLQAAEKLLKNLGALDLRTANLKITLLGALMAQFPVSPRYAKMLIVAARQNDAAILGYIICITAGMSVGDPFLRDADLYSDPKEVEEFENDAQDKEERSQKRGKFFKVMQMFAGSNPSSDVLCMLTAIGAYTDEQQRTPSVKQFCDSHFLNYKSMQEIEKLRNQITYLFRTLPFPQFSTFEVDKKMRPPSKKQQTMIRQILLCGFGDQIARLNEEKMSGYGKTALPLYETMWSSPEEEFVLHPSSVLFRSRPAAKYIIYDQVVGKEERFSADGKEGIVRGNADKKWLKGITFIDASWIAKDSSPLCSHGKILDQPEPKYNPKQESMYGYTYPTYGPKMWQLPLFEQRLEGEQTLYFAKAVLEGKVPGSEDDTVFSILLVRSVNASLISSPNRL
jgi:ATP-dependent RNA helicase DHX37/DHR1